MRQSPKADSCLLLAPLIASCASAAVGTPTPASVGHEEAGDPRIDTFRRKLDALRERVEG